MSPLSAAHQIVGFIASASTEKEVLRFVEGYLAEWTPEELRRLPERCQPAPSANGDDLVLQALILARNGFEGLPLRRGAHSLEELRAVFKEAAIRISVLRAPPEQRERLTVMQRSPVTSAWIARPGLAK